MLGTLLKWFDGEGSRSARDKSKSFAPDSGVPRVKLNKLYEGDRGIHDLHSNSAVLRIYLPVPAMTAMDESIAEMGVTAAKYLREYFVVYLYGAHELLRMKADTTGIYYEPPPVPPSQCDGQAIFSRAEVVDCIPGLGKNIVPIKLYLHKKMKADLENLAKDSGIPLGQFVREILVSHFLGHTVWPERKQAWTAEQQKIADDWVDGKIEEHRVRSPSTEEETALEGKVEPCLSGCHTHP